MADANHEPTPVERLDGERLAGHLVMLPLVCAQLRHTTIRATLNDYVHPVDGNEMELQFLRDILDPVKPVDEILDRWYGGREVACRAAADIMDGVLSELLPASFLRIAGEASQVVQTLRDPD